MLAIQIMKDLFRNFKTKLELCKYDRFTISEYFRKQGVQIGEGCSIIPTSLGTEPYLIKIGNHVAISYGVAFLTHDGAAWIFREKEPNMQVFGPIVIDDNCVIGQNAIIFPNVRIGPNSIVGAGSVVVTDIPPNTVAIGVPARPFSSIAKYHEKCSERWAAQCPPGCIIEEGANWWNSRHQLENRAKLKRHLLQLFSKELDLEKSEKEK